MWICEICKQKFDEAITAVEVRFGYVDCEQATEDSDQYMAFNTESTWAPLCGDCTIAYIKREQGNGSKL